MPTLELQISHPDYGTAWPGSYRLRKQGKTLLALLEHMRWGEDVTSEIKQRMLVGRISAMATKPRHADVMALSLADDRNRAFLAKLGFKPVEGAELDPEVVELLPRLLTAPPRPRPQKN